MRLSRRNLIATLSTLAGGLVAARLASAQNPGLESRIKNRLKRKPPAPTPFPFVYFGTDTLRGTSKGIYVSRFDPTTGHLTSPTLATPCIRPSWFAVGFSGKRRVLYVCNEGDGPQATISSFAIDATGALHPLNQVTSVAPGACYLSVDATGQSVFIADYSGSTVATYRIQPDGSLSQPVERLDFKDARFGHTGPSHARQDASHPHCAMLTPDDRFLLVNDLGNDTITTFPVDASTAKLGPPHVHERRPGSGPRHLAFHPNGRWIYAVNELDNHVDQLLLNTTRGDIAHGFPPQALLTDTGHTISTLDPGFHGTNTAAEIAIAPSGRFIYVSNRGEDSLVVFTIDDTTGALTVLQRISCGGKAPRHFTLDPTGNWLICGNQDSATVTVFARNQGTGHLTGPVQILPLDSVQFTLFA